ncbi:hypothetical protein F3Y22_tig00112738pilonHSYRG00917 [Hibiscus syriacus]|uniref:Integrase catalytic domain-containing protein n=1 Tax=Hibiscus syriacus TaxID=106335 RepID=A0A6A2WUP3_HIBSY|nr:hypothetical protein F3Y22_tig00112738pilonHSYRG00917 [Hibiscus syriacus]
MKNPRGNEILIPYGNSSSHPPKIQDSINVPTSLERAGSPSILVEQTIPKKDVIVDRSNKIPMIKFSDMFHDQIDTNMRNILVVRLLGWPIGFKALWSFIQELWKPMGELHLIDLANNYFLVRYYSKSLFQHIASAIGRVLKVDYSTQVDNRGRIARLAILIDLNKPLLPFMGIDGYYQKLEYEGIQQNVDATQKINENGPTHSNTYGLWMMVENRSRRNVPSHNPRKTKEPVKADRYGSGFTTLSTEGLDGENHIEVEDHREHVNEVETMKENLDPNASGTSTNHGKVSAHVKIINLESHEAVAKERCVSKPNGNHKVVTIEESFRLDPKDSIPWFIGGDLNVILNADERTGGSITHVLGSRRLANFIHDIGNSAWIHYLPNSQVMHLKRLGSDHRPLLIQLTGSDYHNQERPSRYIEACHIGKKNWSLVVRIRGIERIIHQRYIVSLENLYNKLHPCAYFKRSGDNDFVILLLYVDDMLVAGPNKDHIEELKAQLAREFEIKDLGSGNKILGMQIHRDRSNRKIWLSQKNYLKKILSRFNMQDCKPISTPLPIIFKLSSSMSPSREEERIEMSRVPYASAVGSLMFAMICTRPDIAQAVGVVSRYMANPGKEHWNASVVATSTTEAEYASATQASKEAIWLKMLLEELGHNQDMSPSSEEERMEMSRVSYASAVGSLMFAMICTRPDIAQAVGVVSRYMANLVVRDVWNVKGLKKNLLSYGLLDNNASKIETRKGIMKVFRGALVVLKGEKIAANLYILKGETLLEAEASVASCSSDSAMLWHQKLGHMSEQGMKVLVEKKLLPGLTKVSLTLCEHCITSKQHRLKFNTTNSRGKSVLESVHSDVWQDSVTSLGGAKYFVSFIDDYSRRCWVYPTKKKPDVFSTFKNFKARVELDSGNKIKCFRTDNGGEYKSEEFDDFCRKEGIKRQFTVANTPQQNEVAEQMNRTLLERTRAMLRDAGLEKSLWAEAVYTACYLVNRAPSTAIELKTPMEMWTGKPVDYSNLHVFGSIVYVMYNSQEISKLDPKSRKCKFLGYADGVKGYRLWDPTALKVIISSDVIFVEDKLQRKEEDGSAEKSETIQIHVEKEFEQGDSFEAEPAHYE